MSLCPCKQTVCFWHFKRKDQNLVNHSVLGSLSFIIPTILLLSSENIQEFFKCFLKHVLSFPVDYLKYSVLKNLRTGKLMNSWCVFYFPGRAAPEETLSPTVFSHGNYLRQMATIGQQMIILSSEAEQAKQPFPLFFCPFNSHVALRSYFPPRELPVRVYIYKS